MLSSTCLYSIKICAEVKWTRTWRFDWYLDHIVFCPCLFLSAPQGLKATGRLIIKSWPCVNTTGVCCLDPRQFQSDRRAANNWPWTHRDSEQASQRATDTKISWWWWWWCSYDIRNLSFYSWPLKHHVPVEHIFIQFTESMLADNMKVQIFLHSWRKQMQTKKKEERENASQHSTVLEWQFSVG